MDHMLKKKLYDLEGFEIIGGLITSRIENKNSQEGERVKVLIAKAILNGGVVHSSLSTMYVKSIPDESKLTHEGDIVIKLSTPYDACLIQKEDEGLLVPSFCAIIRGVSKEVSKRYLFAFINSELFVNQVKNNLYGSITMMTTRVLKDIEVIIPNVKKQERISDDYFETLEKEKIMNKIISLEKEKINSEFLELMEGLK